MTREPSPPSTEHDVVVCWREPGGLALARDVVSDLETRGFRVFSEALTAAAGLARGLEVVGDTPDVVLVLTPGALEPCGNPQDPLRKLLAQALATGRNVVPLLAAPGGELSAATLPAALARLAAAPPVSYVEGVGHKASMATLAHRLSSETSLHERRDERRVKRWFLAAAAVLVVGFALQAVPQLITAWTRPRPKPPLAPFALYWAGVGERLEQGRWAGFELSKGSRLADGDRLRLAFSPGADGFAYVIARDARGGIGVLFPPEGLAGASRVKAGQLYEAPAGGEWFTVDAQAGLEAVFLIAGYDPYQNLEELTERPETELTPADRRDLLNSTLSALLDGRHAPSDRARTRSLQSIDRSLPPGPGPATSHVTLGDGAGAARAFTREVGLVSALAELRFRYEPR